MATAVVLGVSAVAAAILGRSIVRHGFLLRKGAAEEFVKGGFRAKMDRKEAIQILGLKYGLLRLHPSQDFTFVKGMDLNFVCR